MQPNNQVNGHRQLRAKAGSNIQEMIGAVGWHRQLRAKGRDQASTQPTRAQSPHTPEEMLHTRATLVRQQLGHTTVGTTGPNHPTPRTTRAPTTKATTRARASMSRVAASRGKKGPGKLSPECRASREMMCKRVLVCICFPNINSSCVFLVRT